MSSRSGGGTDAPAPSVDTTETALELTPRVEPVGLGDIHETLRITRLDFEAEIYVLPDGMEAVPGQAAIRFRFADGVASTELRGDALRLMRSGTYQVLVRVRPRGDGSSVVLGGEYLAPEALEKPDEEPAPIPADEPAPIPADEPAPIPADDDDEEPAPIPADEPAPIPADEPAPIPADENGDEPPSADEPAPIPADRTGDDAREKPEDFDAGDTDESGEPVFVRSSRPFEFYAGTVDVSVGSTELVVTWDVRNWLRALLAEPLGLPADSVIEDANGTGFSDVPTDFNVRAH